MFGKREFLSSNILEHSIASESRTNNHLGFFGNSKETEASYLKNINFIFLMIQKVRLKIK
jgi:hypothetical protein